MTKKKAFNEPADNLAWALSLAREKNDALEEKIKVLDEEISILRGQLNNYSIVLTDFVPTGELEALIESLKLG